MVFDNHNHASQGLGTGGAWASSTRHLHGFNLSFLRLLMGLQRLRAAARKGNVLGLDPALIERIGVMAEHERRLLARCRFALFDLYFTDAVLWETLVCCHHRKLPHCCPQAPNPTPALAQFTSAGLYFAWNLLTISDLQARLAFGLPRSTCASLSRLEPARLIAIARSGSGLLRTQLADNPRLWPDLVWCATRGTHEQLEAARLLGIQLLAARA